MKKFLILFLAIMPLLFLSIGVNGQNQRERGLKVGSTPEEIRSGRTVELWATIIGVSRYKNGDQNLDGYQISNLKNAADDAQAIYDFLRSEEGGSFKDVSEGGHVILLKDEQATKVNVELALASLKQAKPDDYFVIYIAAHGALVPQREPNSKTTVDFPYFVLYDTDLRDMPGTGLRMEIFRQAIGEMKAKKGLVLSDTCHSAGVQLAGRDPSSTSIRANVKYLGEMSKVSSGIGFISAADQLEQSYERDDLNQGVFTYSLLEGLRGNADVNEDGIVAFNELVGYLREQVPKLTEHKQHPFYNTTTIETNYIPLSMVRYSDVGLVAGVSEFGTLVIRTPEVDGVEVSIDGSPVGILNSKMEKTVKVRAGARSLYVAKGTIKRNMQTTVEPGKSKIVEVNLTFSEGEEESLVEPTERQVGVFLREDGEPSKEARDLFLKGVDSFNKLKYETAIDQFTRAAQANGGGYSDAMVYRGRAEQSLGRKEAAVISFKSALALRPTDFETRTLLAEAKFNAGYDVNEVVIELRDILTLHPNFEYARIVLGDVLFWRRDLIGAERQLRRAILINPKSPPAHMILADLLTYQGNITKQKEAITEAEKALNLFEEVSRKRISAAKGLKRLSISHVIFGGARYTNDASMAEANHILAKAITRLVERDETLAERDQYLDRARVYIQEAIKLSRNASIKRRLALTLDTSAQNYLLKGDLLRAIEDAEQALKISDSIPDLKGFPEAHYTLYSAYSSNQKFMKAAEHLQKFIEGYGPQLTPQERKAYEDELNRLRRAASANRQ
jgi:uncharacterized caspase-like protein/tetratricopeptide (TPR) repeat protein